MAETSFDILVVGSGAVGLCAALTFAREGFRTALVGTHEARRDGRTVALLHGSVRMLEALEVWPELARDAAPLETMQLIDDTGSLFRPPPAAFRASEIDLDAFGWNVENAVLTDKLFAKAASVPDLARIARQAVDLDFKEGGGVLLDDGSAISARLVIAADGRRSRLRDAAGIPFKTWSYPQMALTTILAHTRDHRETSTEFHTRQGPFTLVPLPGRRSSLVWVTSPERAQALSDMSDQVFAREIEKQAQSLLGAMTISGPRGCVPVGGLSVERFTAPHLALVGEAAHVFPPIGAQGLNLGLRDVAALRDAVFDGQAAEETLGGPEMLQRYQRGRTIDVRARTSAVHGLNRTLLSSFLPADFIRGAGLLALSEIGPLRRAVMREGVTPRFGAPRLMAVE